MKKFIIILSVIFIIATIAYAKVPRRGTVGYKAYDRCMKECYEENKDCIHKCKRRHGCDCREECRECKDSCQAEYDKNYRK